MGSEINISTTLDNETSWNTSHLFRRITDTDILNLTLHGLFGLLGVITNSLTIVVIINGKRFARGMKVQLINLAVIELFCALLTPPSGFIRGLVTINYPNSDILCIAQQYFTVTMFINSLYCKVSISLERFVAVYYPLKMLSYTEFRATVVAIIGWILSFGFHVDIIKYSRVYKIPELEDIHMCISENKKKELVWRCVTAGRFILPVLLLLLSYTAVAVRLARGTKIGETRYYSENKRNRRAILMLAVVGIITVISWSPIMAPRLISDFESRETTKVKEPSPLNIVFFSLLLSNCFTTNIVYLIFSKDYRADVKLVFICTKEGRLQELRRGSTISRLSIFTSSAFDPEASRNYTNTVK